MAHIGNHGTGDHEDLISGRRSKIPSDPDYVPLVYPQKTDNEDNDTKVQVQWHNSRKLNVSISNGLRATKVTKVGNKSTADTFRTYS